MCHGRSVQERAGNLLVTSATAAVDRGLCVSGSLAASGVMVLWCVAISLGCAHRLRQVDKGINAWKYYSRKHVVSVTTTPRYSWPVDSLAPSLPSRTHCSESSLLVEPIPSAEDMAGAAHFGSTSLKYSVAPDRSAISCFSPLPSHVLAFDAPPCTTVRDGTSGGAAPAAGWPVVRMNASPSLSAVWPSSPLTSRNGCDAFVAVPAANVHWSPTRTPSTQLRGANEFQLPILFPPASATRSATHATMKTLLEPSVAVPGPAKRTTAFSSTTQPAPMVNDAPGPTRTAQRGCSTHPVPRLRVPSILASAETKQPALAVTTGAGWPWPWPCRDERGDDADVCPAADGLVGDRRVVCGRDLAVSCGIFLKVR